MDITEEKLEGIIREGLKEQREEFQRFVGVLVEELTGQVKAVAEALLDTNRRITEMQHDIEAMKQDIEVIKMDIHIIKTELKQKVDRDEFSMLEQRVAALETKR